MAVGRALGRQMEATTPSWGEVRGSRGGPILSRRVKSSPPPGLVVTIRPGPGRTLRKHRPCCVGRHISYDVEIPVSALGLAWLGLASPWPLLGPPWPPLTSPWPSLGAPWASHGLPLASLDIPSASPWAFLSVPWPPLGLSWPPPGAFCPHFGSSRRAWRPPLAFLGVLLASP